MSRPPIAELPVEPPKAEEKPVAKISKTAGITPAQRAAVIITLLGESGARPIAEKLDNKALSKVAAELENISFLSRDQLVEIVVEFLTQLRETDGALRGGKAMARDLLSAIVEPKRLDVLLGGGEDGEAEAPAEDGDVWQRLVNSDPGALAGYLGRLTPNIIALILRRMDTSVASKVLARLEEDKLGPTLGHMVDAPQTDPGVFNVVGKMVEMEFLSVSHTAVDDDTAHLETVGELLSLVPTERRERLVLFLRNEHESKIEAIEGGMITIDLLPQILPRVSIPVVFRELDMQVLLKVLCSLKGRNNSIIDYLLGNISSRMADQYREELERQRELSPEEADTVQRDFLTALMTMKREGLITLEKPPRRDPNVSV